jgi:hypothetical protein
VCSHHHGDVYGEHLTLLQVCGSTSPHFLLPGSAPRFLCSPVAGHVHDLCGTMGPETRWNTTAGVLFVQNSGLSIHKAHPFAMVSASRDTTLRLLDLKGLAAGLLPRCFLDGALSRGQVGGCVHTVCSVMCPLTSTLSSDESTC